jgi:Family of unknown function (DUF6221)
VTERPRGGSTRERILSFLLARLTDDTVQASRMAVTPAGTGSRRLPSGCAPERLLREVAAKRAIIQVWLRGLRAEEGPGARWPGGPCDPVIAELVSVYADHPKCDRSWLPPGCGAHPPGPGPSRPSPSTPTVPAPRRRLRMMKP